MPEVVSIARVPLARSSRRLLAAPAIAMLLGTAAVVAGLALGGWSGIVLALAGLATGILAAWLGLTLVSIRLDVEVSAIRLHWMGGERRFTLVRGPVTRVELAGPSAVTLRARFGAFGWTIGRARLRGVERIEIVRLASTRTLILVPTEGIRLAIAPRSEGELITALRAAAHVQQRLDAARARMTLPVGAAIQLSAPVAPVTPPRLEPIQPAPRVLTGIERVELEARLAAQRAVALAAAEEERRHVLEEVRVGAVRPAASVPARQSRSTALVPALPALRRPAWTRPSTPQLASVGLLMVPLAGAGLAWLLAVAAGHAHGEPARSLVLALVLAGPAATLGAIGARIWWPRIVPLVVASALFALVVVGRALMA